MSLTKTYYMAGCHRQTFYFRSTEDSVQGCVLMREIHQRAKKCEARKDRGDTHEFMYKTELFMWLKYVKEEIEDRWGIAFVPSDVRSSIHDAQRVLGLPQTEFPSIKSKN